jgi:hypothetical protein
MNFGSLNGFILFETFRKDFKRSSHSTGPNPARGRRPIGCGDLLWHRPSWPHSRAGEAQHPARARAAGSHRTMATRVTVGWRGQQHLAGRPGVGEPVGIAHV